MTSSKYNNIRTQVGGYTFDSRKEAEHYLVLKGMQNCGAISNLQLQPSFPLVVNGELIGVYRADFEFVQDGQRIVQDVKGYRTQMYNMKKKLISALYGIEIEEV